MKISNNLVQLAATDLSNHLSCEHLTQLERKVILEEIERPHYRDPSLDILIQRGQDHEAAYVKYLREKGRTVVDLRGQSAEATLAVMKNGPDVITQARLENGIWGGIADILLRVDQSSAIGKWSYVVQDTKLSQNTKAATILQLCLYTDLLSLVQGTAPEKMYVIKPGDDFPEEAYRFAEFAAYYRLVKQQLEQLITAGEQNTYPDPVEHCSICRWWQICDKKRHADDHLSLVAGLRSLHIVELQRQHIQTLQQFATTPELQKPERGNKETLIHKQSQATLQLHGREQKKLLYEVLSSAPASGFNRLPEPLEGDVYFDIEGDAYYEDGGLEYLLGYAYLENGMLIYEKIWSTNRTEEGKSFGQFMKFISERWKRFPKMHIYHFAPYEPTVVKRLARVHALFETAVDDLLRAGRFIDLHSIFKEALRASVESYSLKELEKFTPYARKVELHDASVSRKAVEVALELHNFTSLPNETIQLVEGYNEDDCLATEALHHWLENLRTELVGSGSLFQRPELKSGEATENIQQLDTWSQSLFRTLTEKLPEDRAAWTAEEKVKWLLAHQIEYFRREDKSAWWEFYRVHELAHEDLLDERKAITGLEFVSVLPKEGKERNQTHRYRYPVQEISIDEGDALVEVKGETIGSVKAISIENRTIDIKKAAKFADIHPYGVHVSERVNPDPLATSLMDLAAQIDQSDLGHSWPYRASKDLLMKREPRLQNGEQGAYVLPGEDLVAAGVRVAVGLDQSVLAIQGPPGSGKTYMGASMILALSKAGMKIGITAVSHKVIRNLSEATLKLAREQNLTIAFVHKITDATENLPPEIVEVDKSDKARAALAEGKVVCGTAWLWSEANSREVLDYLLVDEAGQMSLSQVLAASRASKNLILLGDPQQLEQPQRGSHPEGSDVAGLTYLLDGHPTMPEGKGLFLGVTRRLHPSICKFTSEQFYEGRLTSLPGLENQRVSGSAYFNGAGLYYVPVPHRGNQNRSQEEVNVVAKIVDELLSAGSWTNQDGVTNPLKKEDILIVAPYNAQVAALLEKLPDMRIGTVDKFQGQEAPIVIYTMTASSIEDAPKGMAFLFNPNRLNVATSRAKSICILVASPKLFEADCKTIDQMRWANSVCDFKERATEVII